MNIPQLTALCLRYHGVLLDASEEVVHVAVVDAPSHELLDALHFATTKRIEDHLLDAPTNGRSRQSHPTDIARSYS